MNIESFSKTYGFMQLTLFSTNFLKEEDGILDCLRCLHLNQMTSEMLLESHKIKLHMKNEKP